MDLSAVGSQLHALFPHLPRRGQVRLLGAGFSSYAVSVGERWLFRIARNADAQASHRRELALLPLLLLDRT